MDAQSQIRGAATGRALVAAQFALIAWLLWPFTKQEWGAVSLALVVAAAVAGVWTLVHNRPGNFNIRPEPKTGGKLVMSGPYRLVRHPMYSALLLFAAGEVLAHADAWKLIAWALLAAVLLAKSRLEERGLAAQFPGYPDYARRVRRLIPGLF